MYIKGLKKRVEVINELIERTKSLKEIDYMNGKTLRGILTSIDITNPYDIGDSLTLDSRNSKGISIEDFIMKGNKRIKFEPTDKSRLLDLIVDEDEYFVDTFTVHEGNGQLNLGVQTYKNLTDESVLSLVVFAEKPTIMGAHQLITSFWFASEYEYRKWLRQHRLVRRVIIDDKYEVSVYASNHSHQVHILVCENGREIAFIVTKQNLKELDGSLENFVEKEFKKIQPKVNQ